MVAVVILAILMSGIFTGMTCLIVKRKQAHKKIHITQESIEETPRGYTDMEIDPKDLKIKAETPRQETLEQLSSHRKMRKEIPTGIPTPVNSAPDLQEDNQEITICESKTRTASKSPSKPSK